MLTKSIAYHKHQPNCLLSNIAIKSAKLFVRP